MGELCVGVGAGSSVRAADIVAAVDAVRGAAPIGVLATLERKAAQPPFVEAAKTLGARLIGFTADELAAIRVPHPTDGVETAVGTPSVAEAAAVLAAGGAPLIVAKTVTNGVTAAASVGDNRDGSRSVSKSVE